MKKALFILTTLIAVLTASSIVRAQSRIDLTVYPAVVEQEIKPNTPTRFLLQFRNNSTDMLSGRIKVADYVINDKTGTPTLVEDDQMSLKYAASKWITPLNDQVTIPPNDYVAINIAVNPPVDIGACGHYAIVYFEPFEGAISGGKVANTESESSIITKVGALVNLKTVSKQCKQGLDVLAYTVPQFLEYGPIKVTFDLFNKGDVHITPIGTVTATNMFKSAINTVNIKEQRIFPETAKSYEVVLGKKYMVGKYAVLLQGKYGDSGLPFSKVAYVWVFPWKIATVIVLAIVILLLLGKNMYKGIVVKEASLEKEIAQERKEIEDLKEQLKKKGE